MKLKDYLNASVNKKYFGNNKYKCDKCKSKFMSDDVILREVQSNISIVPHPMMGRLLQIHHENKIYLCHCPICDQVHLFGFNKVL
jgi:transposase-like protein